MLATVSVDWQHMQLDRRSAEGKGTAQHDEVNVCDNGDPAGGSTLAAGGGPCSSTRSSRMSRRSPQAQFPGHRARRVPGPPHDYRTATSGVNGY
jgi:hypothetical protein